MRVGIDCTVTGRLNTGLESSTLSLTCALLQLESPTEFTLFLPRPIPEPLLPLRHRFRGVESPFGTQLLPNQIWLAAAVRSSNLDLMHYPAYPPILPSGAFVMTLHDAVAWKFGRTMSNKSYVYWRTLLALWAKRSRRIITPSESSRDEIVRRLGCPLERVTVVHHGVRTQLLTYAGTTGPSTLQMPGLPQSFALVVGTVEPRKNLELIVRALARFRAQGMMQHLVVVGRLGWGAAALKKLVAEANVQDMVIFADHVSDDHLATLYMSARFLVQPSWHEGFSMPVLEAMALGCPVLASRIPTHLEVVGDAGWFFAPEDVGEVTTLMNRLFHDDLARASLAAKGMKRAQGFSWETAARRTLEVYQDVCNELICRQALA